ncbi:MAG: thiopurine S-methyltransferase [Pseudomonadota bacterium]
MEQNFWQQRWADNKIAFHERAPNTLLTTYLDRLNLKAGGRVFVPLCGKAHDLLWISAQGFDVIGVELSRTAVESFFDENGRAADVVTSERFTHYRSERIELLVGDFFNVSPGTLGLVDGVYDRAALVALPAAMRRSYAARLSALTETAPQFLITYEYDQSQTEGPPFSVTSAEVDELYGDRYRREDLGSIPISGPLADRCSGTERACILQAR